MPLDNGFSVFLFQIAELFFGLKMGFQENFHSFEEDEMIKERRKHNSLFL
uniref:Uncharacterized protein n=1 Tax=Rhizophora mucronata TaxID=61149 RepID=A0A2P2JJB3_RHIMU